MDFNKLSHRELVHGMTRFVQNMIHESDPLLSSYVDHLVFLTSLAAEGGFINEPFLKYDHYVVDKAMRTGSGFDVDSMAISRYFNMDSRRGNRGRGRGQKWYLFHFET